MLQSSRLSTSALNEGATMHKVNHRDVAIIGMGVNFPCAPNLDAFWKLLSSGGDAVRRLPYARLQDLKRYLSYEGKSFDEHILRNSEAAFLEEIDKFDCAFFRLSPREASLMDPNHRIFLQTAWTTIEEAGYGADKLKGTRTGVFVGSSTEAEYKKMISTVNPNDLSVALTGNINAVMSGRLSYLLDLRGPSLMVDTSCSSSLVAVHLACQSIQNGECDMALAGGIQIHILPIRKTKVGIESSNGRTRTFDDQSDGTGTGEGAGIIMLKPLHKALSDGDHIHAVIRGSATNQDGKSIGLTAPNAKAQEEVMLQAWSNAGVDPEKIGFIEAHGTGTKLGDPIEIDGIRRAFSKVTQRKQFCAVGSVKSNLGHLDNAAGIAGLIKSVLALKNRKLPPTLHVRNVNRSIQFEDSPVYVNDSLRSWESEEARLCGVSSFGISGTNCHIVLEEAPEHSRVEDVVSRQVFTLSARNLSSLQKGILSYLDFIEEQRDVKLVDLCYTTNTGRNHWEYRLAIICNSIDELRTRLTQLSIELTSDEEKGIYFGICKLEDQMDRARTWDGTRLNSTCKRFVDGAAINWHKAYEDLTVRRVSLPTYFFEKRRCWLDIPDVGDQPSYYSTRWEKLSVAWNVVEKSGTVLVFHDNSSSILALLDLYRAEGIRVIEAVVSADCFYKKNEDHYSIRLTENDFEYLSNHLQDVHIDRIIHALTLQQGQVEDSDELEFQQKKAITSLVLLIKSFSRTNHNSNPKLLVLSSYAVRATGEQREVYPLHAALLGLCKVIRWEQPQLGCRCIDIDAHTDMRNILEEIYATEDEFQVAYRSDQRFVERLVTADLVKTDENESPIRERGVYVITGGLGQIGLQFASYLAKKNNVQILLLNRTAFPNRSQWKELAFKGNGRHITKQIRAIEEIEMMGSSIDLYQVDVSDFNHLNKVLKEIRERYKHIHGVIHCAGIGVGMTGVPIQEDCLNTFDAVLAPKISGTWNLLHALKQDNLDFTLLFSSVITLIGAVGSGSYTTANAYLDAISDWSQCRGKRVTTINWPYWLQDFEHETVEGEQRELFKFIAPQAAFNALNTILGKKINRVVVGQLNHQSDLFKLKDYLPIKLSEELYASMKDSLTSRIALVSEPSTKVKLTSVKGSEISEMERFVASIWHEVLGLEELSSEDNFFDIGGDSILITKVHSMLEERYTGQIRMADLFAHPTISKISSHLANISIQDLPGDQENIRDSILRLVTQLEQGAVTVEQAVEQFHLLEVKI